MVRRAGFSLLELMIAVAIVGILSLGAYPRVRDSMIKSDLRGARTRVVNLLSTARVTAAQSSRTAWLRFNGNTAVVTASPRRNAPLIAANTEDTIGTVVDLNSAFGVTVSLSNG